MWDRKQARRGLEPLPYPGPCPCAIDEDTRHWGSPWDIAFTGGSPGYSCNFCHKTWLIDPSTKP